MTRNRLYRLLPMGAASRPGRLLPLAGVAVLAWTALWPGGAAQAAGSPALAARPVVAPARPVAAVRPKTAWGQAEQVPGLGALGRLGAQVAAVSCASPGNCAAGGSYQAGGNGPASGFVASETGGSWGSAIEVPGLAALNQGGLAAVTAVSCPSAGNCTAIGTYTHGDGDRAGFVVAEKNGTWGQAAQVPGLARLNTGQYAGFRALSCAPAGNCAAGGSYTAGQVGSGDQQAFLVTETKGVWGQAEQAPGTVALNVDQSADTTAVSCPAAGACTAVGVYADQAGGGQQVFTVTESGGSWGTAREQPGLATLNTGDFASTATVSCNAAGSCGTGGSYSDPSGRTYAYVANESGGTWDNAEQVPGAAALGRSGASVVAVSCPVGNSCSAAGDFVAKPDTSGTFLVAESKDAWGAAERVPGLKAINGGSSSFAAISCAAAGDCAATGTYDHAGQQGFVVDEAGGTWGDATGIPGLATLNTGGDAAPAAISCPAAGRCTVAGRYTAAQRTGHGFVASQS